MKGMIMVELGDRVVHMVVALQVQGVHSLQMYLMVGCIRQLR
jgi:hypothetical protein